MLAKHRRLPIQSVRNQRPQKVRRATFLNIKYFPPQKKFSRYGIVLGKAVAKNATKRNQIKRQIFNALPAEDSFSPEPADILIIVTAREPNKEKIHVMIEELHQLLATSH